MWLGNLLGSILGFLYRARLAKYYRGYRVYAVWWLFPSWAAGQTIGTKIFVRPTYLVNNAVLDHEVVHCKQWEKYGLAFPFLYVWYTIVAAFKYGPRKGYRMNKFEREAYGDKDV